MPQVAHVGGRGAPAGGGVPPGPPPALRGGVPVAFPVPLRVRDPRGLVRGSPEGAARLERCGWDGCEVTSFGGHLIEQFFDPQVNQRTDAYGGSLENRTRFGREVLAAVRAAVSDRFIVGFRLTLDQHVPGGLGPDEMT